MEEACGRRTNLLIDYVEGGGTIQYGKVMIPLKQTLGAKKEAH